MHTCIKYLISCLLTYMARSWYQTYDIYVTIWNWSCFTSSCLINWILPTYTLVKSLVHIYIQWIIYLYGICIKNLRLHLTTNIVIMITLEVKDFLKTVSCTVPYLVSWDYNWVTLPNCNIHFNQKYLIINQVQRRAISLIW